MQRFRTDPAHQHKAAVGAHARGQEVQAGGEGGGQEEERVLLQTRRWYTSPTKA